MHDVRAATGHPLAAIDDRRAAIDNPLAATDNPLAAIDDLRAVHIGLHKAADFAFHRVLKFSRTGGFQMANKFDSVTQQGLKAHELAVRYRDALEGRLGAGAIDGLGTNLGLLGSTVSSQVAAKQNQKSSTVSQTKALESTALIVSAIRSAVKAHKADKATAKAYGVGTSVNAKVPKSVQAAALGIIAAWNKNPDKGRALGILDADITALTTSAAAARAADEEQDQKRASAPLATKARDAAGKSIEEAVRKIAAAGALQFATDKNVRGAFEQLTAKSTTKKKPAPAPAG